MACEEKREYMTKQQFWGPLSRSVLTTMRSPGLTGELSECHLVCALRWACSGMQQSVQLCYNQLCSNCVCVYRHCNMHLAQRACAHIW